MSNNNNNAIKTSHLILVNKTGADIRFLEPAIIAAIKAGTDLPEDIADLFKLTIIEVEDGIRGLIDFA